MALVAMKCPIAGGGGGEFDGAHLADRNVGRYLRPTRTGRGPPAVGSRDHELVAVQMDGVVGHGEIADANSHALAEAGHHWGRAREGAAIEGPDVEIQHRADLGSVAP